MQRKEMQMERNQARNRGRKTENPITIFIVIVLFIATLLTPISFNTPEKQLQRAWEKSKGEFFGEEILQFVSTAAKDGAISAKGEHSTWSYLASLPSAVLVTEQGNIGNRRLAMEGDFLYLESDTLGEAAFSAPRSTASTVLCDSAFSDAEMPDLQMRFFRTGIAMADPGLATSGEVLTNWFTRIWQAGKPEFTSYSDEIQVDGKNRKVTVFTSEMEQDGLRKAVDVLKTEGSREETKAAFTAVRQLLSSALSPSETGEAADRFVSFLCGNSSDFSDFEKRILTQDGRATVTTTVYKGRVSEIKFVLKGSDFTLEASLNLDDDLRKNSTWTASVQAKTEMKDLFSLTVNSAITENSDTAFIREWKYSFNDAIGAITDSQGEEEGSVTFSWGKKKGDLGLRFLLGEKEIFFRGKFDSYKEGQELKFSLEQVEYSDENLIEGDTFAVTVQPAGDPIPFGDATEDLFPDGEERQEFADTLRVCFPWYLS